MASPLFASYGSTTEAEPLTMLLTATAIPALLFLPEWWLFTRLSRQGAGAIKRDSRSGP